MQVSKIMDEDLNNREMRLNLTDVFSNHMKNTVSMKYDTFSYEINL